MQIGPYSINSPLILAPMAGITDRPFREICIGFGASLAVSEMVSSNPALQKHARTVLKTNQDGETGIRWVQILGTDPQQMADAARANVDQGAQIIDINMGCPAKKVCAVAAGSALLKNEVLVKQILDKVVCAVPVPVTLKIRTGWDLENRNALVIAKIAENAGISALTIHGRTRQCKFEGYAEYDTIRNVKAQTNIPIIANGDISSPEKALKVLATTGADALMIGRAAQGNPWIFNQIKHYFSTGKISEKQSLGEIQSVLLKHIEHLYSFYGQITGVRMARKHIDWYLKNLEDYPSISRQQINLAEQPAQQIAAVNLAFNHLLNNGFAA